MDFLATGLPKAQFDGCSLGKLGEAGSDGVFWDHERGVFRGFSMPAGVDLACRD